MALSRKRPSAGSLTENVHEDSHPSKKTETSKYNVQSSEGLPFTKSGPVPVIAVILYFREQEKTVRALLDTDTTVPLLSLGFVEKHQTFIAKRPTKRTIHDSAARQVPGAGEFFTSQLLLQHRQHDIRVSFEVALLTGEYDIILHRWSLVKQKCDLLASNGQIKFTLGKCQCKCTMERNDTSFSPEWDSSIINNPGAGIMGIVAVVPSDDDFRAGTDKVPEACTEFIPIMTAEMSAVLPEHSVYDHAIDLKDGTTSQCGPIYPLNKTEIEELQKWLKKMKEMGVVRESKSSCCSPMLFIPQGHGRGLCLCIDYRGINKITVSNRYPFPNMNKLKEYVRGEKWFNKINHKNCYHLIQNKEGGEWKIVFRC